MNALPLLPVSRSGSLPTPPAVFRAEMAPLHEQDRGAMRAAQEAAVADGLAAPAALGAICWWTASHTAAR